LAAFLPRFVAAILILIVGSIIARSLLSALNPSPDNIHRAIARVIPPDSDPSRLLSTAKPYIE